MQETISTDYVATNVQFDAALKACRDIFVKKLDDYGASWRIAAQATALMIAKNHDYDEAWRGMRVKSYTDFILTKVSRTKQIEDNGGHTSVSEGIDANYMDMINYAVFGIIKLTE